MMYSCKLQLMEPPVAHPQTSETTLSELVSRF